MGREPKGFSWFVEVDRATEILVPSACSLVDVETLPTAFARIACADTH
jgi:hypothetical protein